MHNEEANGDSFANILNSEFSRRLKVNPRYSIRAFAKSLKINDSSLSQIMRGKRKVSARKLKEIGESLGLPADLIEQVILDESSRKFEDEIVEAYDFKNLESDQYDIAANWYYSAILEMVEMEGFELKSEWISKRLNISVEQARSAIEKLLDSNYLIVHNKKAINNLRNASTFADFSMDHEVFRSYQKQLRDQAKESIDHDTPDRKTHSSYITVMDSEVLEEVKLEIRKFHDKIAGLIDKKSSKKDCVANLQVSFFINTKEES